jgi:hypothetical protein
VHGFQRFRSRLREGSGRRKPRRLWPAPITRVTHKIVYVRATPDFFFSNGKM